MSTPLRLVWSRGHFWQALIESVMPTVQYSDLLLTIRVVNILQFMHRLKTVVGCLVGVIDHFLLVNDCKFVTGY